MTSAKTIAKRLRSRLVKAENALKGNKKFDEVEVEYTDPNNHELVATRMADGDGGMCWYVNERMADGTINHNSQYAQAIEMEL